MSAPKEKKPSEITADFLSQMREYASAAAFSAERQKALEAEINDIEHRLENRVYKLKASVSIIKHREGGA